MSARKWLNALRAGRDELRQRYSRWLYDRDMPCISNIDTPRRIVFLRWDAKWGDSVVFSFVCRELKRRCPTTSLEVITTPEMAALFSDEFGVDAVHETRRKPSKREMSGLAERIGDIDLVVHFSHLIKSRDMYLLSRLKTRHIAGLDDSVGRVDLKLGEVTRGQHFADKYVTLLSRCGINDINSVDANYIVPRNEDSESRVGDLLSRRSRPYICINAYSKGRARNLSRETTERLIASLLAMLPEHDVCVLSAPGRQDEVEAICNASDAGRVFCLPETHRIHDNVALIARARALVSCITATVHMADGLGVPSFALFPFDPMDCDDWHSRHRASVNVLAEPSDPLDVNCLDWAKVDEALTTFCHTLLQAYDRHPSKSMHKATLQPDAPSSIQ